MAPVIEIDHLTKRFGKVLAVDDVSFAIQPGTITGFLGPNGAGKTTTLRMIVDLVRPTSGGVSVLGGPYADLRAAVDAGRRAARRVGLPPRPLRHGTPSASWRAPPASPNARVEEVPRDGRAPRRREARREGLLDRHAAAPRPRLRAARRPRAAAPRRARQRPRPGGHPLVAHLPARAPAEGKTVLVSSHVLAEVEQTVDDVLIISKGRSARAGAHRASWAAAPRASCACARRRRNACRSCSSNAAPP